MAIYTVSLRDTSGLGQVNVGDGTLLANLSVSAGRGPKGDGWTSVSYDENTGTFIFTSNDGLEYTSPDLRPGLQTYVTAAEAAQDGAEAAQAATEDIFDQFGDQYLGPKASDPTVDNDGDPLTEGDIYFNTTDNVLKFYSGTAWVAPESIATSAATAAQAAQAAAETAETNAETAETNAETAETNAAASASAASTSEANAASSASAAATSASEAASSAASINPNNVDINGGTIDGTVIGGSTPAAGSFTTGSFTGDVSFGDNDKAIFGDGSDLQIYHSGSHSYITDTGTGSLYVRASDFVSIQAADGTNSIVADTDSEVTLYHNGSPKLATTSTGIDVTGTVTADGLTVDGASDSTPAVTISANNNGLGTKNTLRFFDDDGAVDNGQQVGRIEFYTDDNTNTGVNAYLEVTNNTTGYGSMSFATGTSASLAKRMNIGGTGDISFYEDTGTTPKMVWSASAESLGIGESSPSSPLHVNGGGTNNVAIFESTDATVNIKFEDSDQTQGVFVGAKVNDFYIQAGGNEKFRVKADGNVGIGTDNPTQALDVTGTILSTVSTTGDNNFQANSTGGGSFKIYPDDATTANPTWVYKTNSSEEQAWAIGGVERMRLDAAGNVTANQFTGGGTIITVGSLSDGTNYSTTSVNYQTATRFQITPTTSTSKLLGWFFCQTRAVGGVQDGDAGSTARVHYRNSSGSWVSTGSVAQNLHTETGTATVVQEIAVTFPIHLSQSHLNANGVWDIAIRHYEVYDATSNIDDGRLFYMEYEP